MARVLVIGAAGFIGSHVTDTLLAAGHTVIGLDNLRSGQRDNLAPALAQPGFRLQIADAAVPGVLEDALQADQIEAVVHLAALVSVAESVAEPELNFALNVALTQRVAEAVRVTGTPRLVYASSAAVYGTPAVLPLPETAPTCPLSPYGAAKLASEALLFGHASCFGFAAAAFRFFNVYGPRQDPKSPYSGVISIFRNRCQAGEAVTIQGDGRQTRDFVAVGDVARVVAEAAVRATPLATGPYNVGTGRSTTLLELLTVLRSQYPQAPEPAFAPARAGDIRHSCAEPAKLTHALGWGPSTTLTEGLAWAD